MKIFTKNKTTELIKLASGQNKLIVCKDRKEADRIFNYSKELKYDIHLPITYHDFINSRYAASNTESILIDEIEMFLRYISKVQVEAFTMNVIKDIEEEFIKSQDEVKDIKIVREVVDKPIIKRIRKGWSI